ncbi:hypothetical protein L198_05959 [Cryptococcus wingfieldii CBS 7118]|uniref:Uncharacterized protein n=1 Tax=Cryptococcus wingfieldii CBS 7118 TaxID=1295528 RepID=A0A1E3IS43_9TREE|nr:hypothetical protein L198_05959 [Cryptococcus wingfieldii CBS 7118]ODN91443.1 hypothetical protein L198_05959 [Cryptococcus wingfieldii CBS 7118]
MIIPTDFGIKLARVSSPITKRGPPPHVGGDPKATAPTTTTSPFHKTLWEVRHIILDKYLFEDDPYTYMLLSKQHLLRVLLDRWREEVVLDKRILQTLANPTKKLLRACVVRTMRIVVTDVEHLEQLASLPTRLATALEQQRKWHLRLYSTMKSTLLREKRTTKRKKIRFFPHARVLEIELEGFMDAPPHTKRVYFGRRPKSLYDVSAAVGKQLRHLVISYEERCLNGATYAIPEDALAEIMGGKLRSLVWIKRPDFGPPDEMSPPRINKPEALLKLQYQKSSQLRIVRLVFDFPPKDLRGDSAWSMKSLMRCIQLGIGAWVFDNYHKQTYVAEVQTVNVAQVRAALVKRHPIILELERLRRIRFVELEDEWPNYVLHSFGTFADLRTLVSNQRQ